MKNTPIRNCEEALRLLAGHLDGELDEHTAGQLDGHLATCRSCFSRAEFERRLKASIAGLAQEDVPDDLSRRVQTLIGRFSVAGGD